MYILLDWCMFLLIDVREGASADAPGVGLEMVSGLKLLQKDDKIIEKDEKMSFLYCVFILEKQK